MSTPAPKVEYRQLGKSGLRVSVPIMGGLSFGSKEWAAWVLEEKESLEVMKAAWDLGINTIDTANAHSNGVSERIIAKFIEKYNIPRERIIIADKIFWLTPEDDMKAHAWVDSSLKDKRDAVNQCGLSRAAIFNQVDASLARLKTSYVDLLQIHRFDPDTPVEETMKALHDLVESGKVRYIGASSMRAWQFGESVHVGTMAISTDYGPALAMMNEVAGKHGWTKFVSMQDEYSLLYREEEREMIPYCKYNGIGLIPWSPLHGGTLARPVNAAGTTRSDAAKGTMFEKKLSNTDKAIIGRVEELANKKGCTMSQVAISWLNGEVTSPIIGMSSPKRVEENIVPNGKVNLTEEEVKYLEELYLPRLIRMHA